MRIAELRRLGYNSAMIHPGVTYTNYTSLVLQRWSNLAGALHASLDEPSLGQRARRLLPIRRLQGDLLQPQSRRQRLAYDALQGMRLGLQCNVLAGLDYVVGRGMHNFYNRQVRLHYLKSGPGHHEARLAALLHEQRCQNVDYTEQGAAGQFVQTLYTTAAMLAFAPGKSVGAVLGAVHWGLVRPWRGAALSPTLGGCMGSWGQSCGALFGIVAGSALAASAWAALQGTRLTTGATRAAFALAGLPVGLLAGMLGLRAWIPAPAAPHRGVLPAAGAVILPRAESSEIPAPCEPLLPAGAADLLAPEAAAAAAPQAARPLPLPLPTYGQAPAFA